MYKQYGYCESDRAAVASQKGTRLVFVPTVITTADEMLLARSSRAADVESITIPIIETKARTNVRPELIGSWPVQHSLDISPEALNAYSEVSLLGISRIIGTKTRILVVPHGLELDVESSDVPCYPRQNGFDWISFAEAEAQIVAGATSLPALADIAQLSYSEMTHTERVVDSLSAIDRYFETMTEVE